MEIKAFSSTPVADDSGALVACDHRSVAESKWGCPDGATQDEQDDASHRVCVAVDNATVLPPVADGMQRFHVGWKVDMVGDRTVRVISRWRDTKSEWQDLGDGRKSAPADVLALYRSLDDASW